jgi:hypothetical protein
MAGLFVTAMLSGRYVTRTGKYKGMMIGGAILQFVGVLLMAQLGPDARQWDVVWRLFILGAGLGPSQSLFNLVSQSAAPVQQLGVATSTGMFLRQTGGLVGVSIFGAMLVAKLTESVAARFPGVSGDIGQLQGLAMNAGDGGTMPPQMREFVSVAITDAMSYIFMGSLAIFAAAFVAILFIPEITLRGRAPGQSVEKAVEELAPAGPLTADKPQAAPRAD